jgi:hypothetical protein
VFVNWEDYRSILKCDSDALVTTDWAYAIAAHVVGPDKTTMPHLTGISMTHMKRSINDTFTEDWTDSLVYELSPESFRINTFAQLYPVHYHVKSFADKILGSTT